VGALLFSSMRSWDEGGAGSARAASHGDDGIHTLLLF
jgi:hypothetical protein